MHDVKVDMGADYERKMTTVKRDSCNIQGNNLIRTDVEPQNFDTVKKHYPNINKEEGSGSMCNGGIKVKPCSMMVLSGEPVVSHNVECASLKEEVNGDSGMVQQAISETKQTAMKNIVVKVRHFIIASFLFFQVTGNLT